MEEKGMPEEQISCFCRKLRAARGGIVTEHIPVESFLLEKTAVQVRRVFQEITVGRMMTVRPVSKRASAGFYVVQISRCPEHERKLSERPRGSDNGPYVNGGWPNAAYRHQSDHPADGRVRCRSAHYHL